MAQAHKLKTWSVRHGTGMRRGLKALGPRRQYHVSCGCGWEAMFFSRADRKVECGKHQEVGRWMQRSATQPPKASTGT